VDDCPETFPLIGGHDPGRCGWHLVPAFDRDEQVHVVAHPLDEVVSLDGVPAGQRVTVVGGEGVQSDPDESLMELVH